MLIQTPINIFKEAISNSFHFGLILVCLFFLQNNVARAQVEQLPELMNDIVDISRDFWDFTNTYFLADSLTDFNPQTGTGSLQWASHQYETALAFNNTRAVLQPEEANIFPGREYAANPVHQFSIEFVSPKTIRLQIKTGKESGTEPSYPMLVNKPPYERSNWDLTATDSTYIYKSSHGSVVIRKNPWHIEFYDKNGRLLTKTNL